MKSISRIILFFQNVNQIIGMEYASFLDIIQRIFIYLQGLLSWKFLPLTPVSKQVIADFSTLFIICAVVIVIFIISFKLSKNYEGHIIHTEVIQHENLQLIDLTEEEEEGENNHESIYGLPKFHYGCGDGPATFKKSMSRRKKVIRQKSRPLCISTGGDISRHSGFSIKPTQSQHLQNSQKINKTQTSSNSCQTWLVRRTRSGQIYGKYPI